MASENIEFNEEEAKKIEESIAAISAVLKSKNRSIKSIIGLVTSKDVSDTSAAVEVRFAEENVMNVQMNMIAFD